MHRPILTRRKVAKISCETPADRVDCGRGLAYLAQSLSRRVVEAAIILGGAGIPVCQTGQVSWVTSADRNVCPAHGERAYF